MSRGASPGGSGNEIGRVEIGVQVTGVDRTESDLGRVRRAGQRTSDSLTGKFRDFGKSFQAPVQALTRIVGTLSAAIGLATTFYLLGQKIADVLRTGADRAEQFSYNLATQGAQQRVTALDAKLQKLNEQMARMKELGPVLGTALFAQTESSLAEETAKLQKERAAAQRELNDGEAVRRREERKADMERRRAEARAASAQYESSVREERRQTDEDAANERLDKLNDEHEALEELRQKTRELARESMQPSDRLADELAEQLEKLNDLRRKYDSEYIREFADKYGDALIEQHKRAADMVEFKELTQAVNTLKSIMDAGELRADTGRIIGLLEGIAAQRGAR